MMTKKTDDAIALYFDIVLRFLLYSLFVDDDDLFLVSVSNNYLDQAIKVSNDGTSFFSSSTGT
jgi:hypothetical protein